MTSRQKLQYALAHKEGPVPVDLGGTFVTGIHVSVVAALRERLGLERRLVKVVDPGQMLGEVDDELKRALGVDVEPVRALNTRFGFPLDEGWTSWRAPWGQEVLVSGGFTTSTDSNGDILIYPQGDRNAPPSSRLPASGYFADTIIRQDPIDDDRLDPKDNLEEFTPLSEASLNHFRNALQAASTTGRGVMAGFGGTALGDIGAVPAPGLKHPKGIRDVEEWYISTVTRQDYLHAVFSGQVNIALANLERVKAALGPLTDAVDAVYICGADYGTQTSTFCSPDAFRSLYMPHYREITGWIHRNTPWKCFKHSCGAIAELLPLLAEAGFDIINPVQCSATGMDPETIKRKVGRDLVFWGGAVDTQRTLPFGTPAEVRAQALERCRIFATGGGFVFNAIHNIQACTPAENVLALFDAVREFNKERQGG